MAVIICKRDEECGGMQGMTTLPFVPGRLTQTVVQNNVSGHLDKTRQVIKVQPGF